MASCPIPGAHAPGYESVAASLLEFANLVTRPNLRPGSSYIDVTGTPDERKEMCRENNQMMLHDPCSRKPDRRHSEAITGFGARPTLNDNPRTPDNNP